MATKICSACGIEKDISEFYRDKRTKDGLYSNCKKCQNYYTYAWAKRNRGRISEYNKKWREKNQDVVKCMVKKWQSKNKDRILEYHKRWYKDTKRDRMDNTMDRYFEQLKQLESQND